MVFVADAGFTQTQLSSANSCCPRIYYCHSCVIVFLSMCVLNGVYCYISLFISISSKFAALFFIGTKWQRWSPRGLPWPRGHILKSLALASRPQVLENWPVLGSRTALFFELLKFCGALEKFFGKRIFVEIA